MRRMKFARSQINFTSWLHTQLLDELFVLIQFLKGLDIHTWNAIGICFIAVLLISQHADFHLRFGYLLESGMGKARFMRDSPALINDNKLIFSLDTARESLVLLGVVVLQGYLEFNSLAELSFLFRRGRQHWVDSFIKSVAGDFAEVK